MQVATAASVMPFSQLGLFFNRCAVAPCLSGPADTDTAPRSLMHRALRLTRLLILVQHPIKEAALLDRELNDPPCVAEPIALIACTRRCVHQTGPVLECFTKFNVVAHGTSIPSSSARGLEPVSLVLGHRVDRNAEHLGSPARVRVVLHLTSFFSYSVIAAEHLLHTGIASGI